MSYFDSPASCPIGKTYFSAPNFSTDDFTLGVAASIPSPDAIYYTGLSSATYKTSFDFTNGAYFESNMKHRIRSSYTGGGGVGQNFLGYYPAMVLSFGGLSRLYVFWGSKSFPNLRCSFLCANLVSGSAYDNNSPTDGYYESQVNSSMTFTKDVDHNYYGRIEVSNYVQQSSDRGFIDVSFYAEIDSYQYTYTIENINIYHGADKKCSVYVVGFPVDATSPSYQKTDYFYTYGTGLPNTCIGDGPIPKWARALIERKSFIGFALEDQSGIQQQCTYNQLVSNIVLQPYIDSYNADFNDGTYSQFRSISGKRSASIKFNVDLYSVSNATIPPSYFALLRACGWKQVEYEGSGVSIAPDDNYNNETATIQLVYGEESKDETDYRQLLYTITGCMGKVKLVTENKVTRAEFEFIGALKYVETVPNASAITFSNSETVAFPQIDSVEIGSLTIGVNSFSLMMNEQLTLSNDANSSTGYGYCNLTNRLPAIEIDFDVEDDSRLYNTFINNEVNAITVNYLNAALQMSIREAQLISPIQDIGGVNTFLINGIELLQGNKSTLDILTVNDGIYTQRDEGIFTL